MIRNIDKLIFDLLHREDLKVKESDIQKILSHLTNKSLDLLSLLVSIEQKERGKQEKVGQTLEIKKDDKVVGRITDTINFAYNDTLVYEEEDGDTYYLNIDGNKVYIVRDERNRVYELNTGRRIK